MSTIKRIALATGVVASIGTTAGHALAADASVARSAVSASPTFVLPPDYVQLTDDTGSITVAVPNTWTDVSTLPFADEAGNIIPRITAATKCFCTEHEQRVSEFVWRTRGAAATLWDDVTHGLVYSPGYTIMGGTSNVMRNILGERVLGLPR